MRERVFTACALLYVFTTPWQNAIRIPGVGTVARILGIVLLLAYAWVVLSRKIRALPWQFGVFVALVLWQLTSTLIVSGPGDWMFRIFQFLQLLVSAMALWEYARGRRQVENLLIAYVMGGYVMAGIALREYRRIQLESAFGGLGQNRLAIEGFNPNGISLLLAFGLPMALHLVVKGDEIDPRRKWVPVVGMLYIPLALAGQVLVASRGGLVASTLSFVPLLAYFIYSRPTRQRAGALSVVGIGLAVVFVATQIETLLPNLERLASIQDSVRTGDLNARDKFWAIALDLFIKQPILGIGVLHFPAHMQPIFGHAAPPHNVFLSVLAESGIVGFALFLAWVGSCVATVIRSGGPVRPVLLAVLTALFMAYSVANMEASKQAFIFLTTALAAGQLDISPEPEETALAVEPT